MACLAVVLKAIVQFISSHTAVAAVTPLMSRAGAGVLADSNELRKAERVGASGEGSLVHFGSDTKYEFVMTLSAISQYLGTLSAEDRANVERRWKLSEIDMNVVDDDDELDALFSAQRLGRRNRKG